MPATDEEKDAMIRTLLKQIEHLQKGDKTDQDIKNDIPTTKKKEKRSKSSSKEPKTSHQHNDTNNSRDNCAIHGRKSQVQGEESK